MLNRNDGSFMQRWLSQEEIAVVHERLPQCVVCINVCPCLRAHLVLPYYGRCLTWGRQPGNNRVLDFFGTTFETYQNATDTLMGRLRSVLPEGSTRCRIRATARESREAQPGTLLDTLGDETVTPQCFNSPHTR